MVLLYSFRCPRLHCLDQCFETIVLLCVFCADSIKDALEEGLEECSNCEGTGFYAIQSCANHSCQPNASIQCRDSNICTIIAKTTIRAGEEVLISYIDEQGPLSERQNALLDYGFVCSCQLCTSEQIFDSAQSWENKPLQLSCQVAECPDIIFHTRKDVVCFQVAAILWTYSIAEPLICLLSCCRTHIWAEGFHRVYFLLPTSLYLNWACRPSLYSQGFAIVPLNTTAFKLPKVPSCKKVLVPHLYMDWRRDFCRVIGGTRFW